MRYAAPTEVVQPEMVIDAPSDARNPSPQQAHIVIQTVRVPARPVTTTRSAQAVAASHDQALVRTLSADLQRLTQRYNTLKDISLALFVLLAAVLTAFVHRLLHRPQVEREPPVALSDRISVPAFAAEHINPPSDPAETLPAQQLTEDSGELQRLQLENDATARLIKAKDLLLAQARNEASKLSALVTILTKERDALASERNDLKAELETAVKRQGELQEHLTKATSTVSGRPPASLRPAPPTGPRLELPLPSGGAVTAAARPTMPISGMDESPQRAAGAISASPFIARTGVDDGFLPLNPTEPTERFNIPSGPSVAELFHDPPPDSLSHNSKPLLSTGEQDTSIMNADRLKDPEQTQVLSAEESRALVGASLPSIPPPPPGTTVTTAQVMPDAMLQAARESMKLPEVPEMHEPRPRPEPQGDDIALAKLAGMFRTTDPPSNTPRPSDRGSSGTDSNSGSRVMRR